MTTIADNTSSSEARYGYAGKILRVDLSSGDITIVPTELYAENYIGGRGIATRIYWEEVAPDTGALDPENRLIFMAGPMAGFSGLGGNRWEVCAKTPITIPEQFSYCNLGGSWGVQLRFAGYDGMVVYGKSEKPVYVFIEDDLVEIRDASTLWGRTSIETREILKDELGKSVNVVACGPAGENMVKFAVLLADNDAAGSSGMGAVMGSKKLKAIAVRGSSRIAAHDPQKVKELARYVRDLKSGVEEEQQVISSQVNAGRAKKDVCYGCLGACSRGIYMAEDGTSGKFSCGSAYFYQGLAMRYYKEWNDVPFHAARLCNGYGLDVQATITMIIWLMRCERAGILGDENTGIPLSRKGSLEFIETLVKKISFREGFGNVLADGLFRAADVVGNGSRELITDYASKEGASWTYCPRMFVTTGLFYALEPRHPVQQLHEISHVHFPWMNWVQGQGSHLSSDVFRRIARRFWGTELVADFSTYEGKAQGAVRIQDREYAKESLVLCDWMWPIMYVRNSEDHVGDPTIENRLLSAITGREIEEEDLYCVGERIFNLQRAVHVREGRRGRVDDVLPEPFYTKPLRSEPTFNPECLGPGKDGEIISKKGTVVDREKFEKMKDEFYELRGWDVASGLQTRAKLEEIGLRDVADDLERRKKLATSRE